MIWYTAHYGSWRCAGGITRISFDGYAGTYDRKEAFTRAKEAANKTGQKVTVIWEKPTGHGLTGDFEEILPDNEGRQS